METARADVQARESAVAELVDRVVAEWEPLQRRYNEAVWMASVTGEESHQQESAALDTRIRSIFARREPYALLSEAWEVGGVADPGLRRQHRLLLDLFRAHQIPLPTIERMVRLEKSLDTRFNHHRAELDGVRVSDNQIRQVLRASDDGALRRRAWEASKQIGAEVVGELLELVRLRNQAAREIGFEHYYAMSLQLDELDEPELFALLDDLEEQTRPLFAAYKQRLDARLGRRFGVAVDELRPWHYSDPFFQEAPVAELDLDRLFADRSPVEVARGFFAAIGFETDDILRRSDLLEKPGKSQHAFCISIDKLRDVRVLCNLRPNEFWMGTLLHELGHAVYDQAIDLALPFPLRSPAHTLTTEASAMLFGRLSKNAAWLARYVGVPEREADRIGAAGAAAVRDHLLVQARWCLVMSHMERALYRDPDGDLDGLWWDLVHRFQGVRPPEGRRAPDWASKIHFSVAPVYYHNYMLGEIAASQIQATLLETVLGGGGDAWKRFVSSPAVGAHLTERLYRPGRSTDWRAAMLRTCGRALDPAAFVAELARG
jgi:peptidyl-dipeptidase A